MKAHKIVAALDHYARSHGVKPAEPHYIWGEFNLKQGDETLYTDEGHEYCEACARALLEKALPLLPENEREDHRVSATTCDSEDTCKHCMICGALLDYGLNDTGAEIELEHYEAELPNRDTLSAGDAFHIARIVEAAPKDDAVLAMARMAMAKIPQPASAA